MEIRHSKTEKSHIVELDGRLDAVNNAKAETFFNEIAANNDLNILVDLEKLDFINSTGLRVFIMSLKKLKSENRVMTLCNLNDNIKDVFKFSGFDKLFEINLNREEAWAKVN